MRGNLKDINVKVITGVTGSGKTALAIETASKNAKIELINIDSVQLYKYLNIGSAKGNVQNFTSNKNPILPIKVSISTESNTLEITPKSYIEYPNIPIWFIDELEPDVQISVFEFQKIVRGIITDIVNRENTPLLVGGSGFYLGSILFDYRFSDMVFDDTYSNFTLNELQFKLKELNFDLALLNHSDLNNPRRLINLIKKNSLGTNIAQNIDGRLKKYYNFNATVLLPEREEVEQHLISRIDMMFSLGLLEECSSIHAKFGDNLIQNLRNAPGYKQIFDLIDIKGSDYNFSADKIKGMKVQIFNAHKKLVKKQNTWFKKYLPN